MIRLLKAEDKAIVLEFILRHEPDMAFLYGNVTGFGINNNRDMRRCGDYHGYFENNILKGIIAFYNLGSCIAYYESEAAVPYFTQLMRDYEFEYLQGMKKVIKPLYDNIAGSRKAVEIHDSMYLINQDFTPCYIEGLEFVDAINNRSEEIYEFISETRSEGFHQAISRDGIVKNLDQRGNEENYIIACMKGKSVAGACIQTYTPTINQIGAVYTRKEERGKGYAKAVVSELCSLIALRGKCPSLTVSKNNIPAVRAYTAVGFSRYDDWMLIRFDKTK